MKKILLKPFVELDIAWNRLNSFQRARWKLTGLYLIILFIILNIFTGSLFFILQKEEEKHINQLNIQWTEQKILFPDKNITIIELNNTSKPFEKNDLLILQHNFLQTVKKWILIIEGILMFLVGGISYFLSGKTLRPIQKKNQQQKQFLADVSHELRNPLSALKTTLDLSKKQKNWKKGEINEVLSDIDTEISRLITLSDDLILLEKTKNKNNFDRQDISLIIKKVYNKCTPLSKIKNIKFILDLAPISLAINKEDLEKVLFNLFHNAIKFSFSNSKIEVKLLSNGLIEIKDFGIGISKKDLPKIFNRFYKVDCSRTFTEENGSGLGLSIVKKICNKNNWKISVESEKDKGTKVILNLA